MHVVLSGQSGVIAVKGPVVSFTPTGEDGGDTVDVLCIAASDISQLMRSRKDQKVAKLVASRMDYLAVFDSLSDRETFIEAVVTAQTPPGNDTESSGSADRWRLRVICGAAVDAGILTDDELNAIMDGECQRGVAQPIDALETLVDRNTYQLLPITEQMENDIFRQIPALAAIFQTHVVDGESKKAFWEAVVRKYFCFSRTFLEEELNATNDQSVAPGGRANSSGIVAINAASLRALPKHGAAARVEGTVDAGWVAVDGSVADTDCGECVPVHAEMFCTRRPMPTLSTPPSLVALVPTATPPQPLRGSDPFEGHEVSRVLPQEPTHREALETLRKYWRSDPTQRKGVLSKYTSRPGRESFLEAVCFKRAHELVD